MDFALWAAVIASAFTLVLFFYCLGLRVARILHERELARLRGQWWPVIARATMDDGTDDIDITSLRRGSRVMLLREWCRFRSLVTGSSCRSLQWLADDLDLLAVARRVLRRRTVSAKLLAVQALGFLRDRESWDDIVELLHHRNVTISITAATALVYIDPKSAIAMVMPLIGNRRTWPRTQVGRMLNLAGSDAVTIPLCGAIQNADTDEACRLLQFHESASMQAMDDLVAQLLLTRTDPRLIAAALKAVRGTLPNKIVERLSRHKMWFVRMQAAALLGRFGRREDYRILEPLLSDSEWWVRYRAAQAITRLPFLGPHALRKLCKRQTDRYAGDIMQQALAEVGIA